MKKALCVISGGMDSTLCAYIAKDLGYEIVGLHFDYEQRTMKKEKECFLKICSLLDIGKRVILDASFIKTIGANALTDRSLQIPKDRKELKEQIPISYVPFRNGIFLSIAGAVAEVHGCEALFIGVVEEDSSGYPDCKEEFIKAMQKAINLGRVCSALKIITPLVHLSKADVVKKSLELGVALEHTWSCYEKEDKACGHCDSCLLRLKGFKEVGIKDPIEYKN